MYGYLFSKSPLVTTPYCSYVSIVVAQETGYNIKFTRCKVFKIPLIERVEEIDVHSLEDQPEHERDKYEHDAAYDAKRARWIERGVGVASLSVVCCGASCCGA